MACFVTLNVVLFAAVVERCTTVKLFSAAALDVRLLPISIATWVQHRAPNWTTTWLHRIVVNASLDRLRRRAARPALSGGDEQAFEALVAHDGDPARAADTRLDVDAALRILPPQQRAALVVVDMLGFSVADAAVILDTSPGTVKSRCARARARLLPYVAHLQGNRSASESVQPAQGGDT